MNHVEFSGNIASFVFPRALGGPRHLKIIGIPIGILMFAAWGRPGRENGKMMIPDGILGILLELSSFP